MSLQRLFLLTLVVALVLLSPGIASASTQEAGMTGVPIGVWNWIDGILNDRQRMVQVGALVVVVAIYLLVKK